MSDETSEVFADPSRDAHTALSILQKAAKEAHMFYVERDDPEHIWGMVESTWFALTPDEADLVERLRREVDGQ